MPRRASPKQARMRLQFGENIRRWRRVNGMSASELARRAFVTRETLRNIENGHGSPRMDSIFAVLETLGISEKIVESSSPYSSDAARARLDDIIMAGGTV